MNWQELIQENLCTAEELKEPLQLSQQEYESIRKEIKLFPMSVSRYYFSLIDPSDPDDPIRKMAIPSGRAVLTDGLLDTSGETGNTRLRGLQHKYSETAMVLTTAACAMFCRHCFRRRLVGKESDEVAVDLSAVAAYIRDHPQINNVLLSGGDAFMLPTPEIARWLEALVPLEQLDFIRFGTRTPVTFPHRILTDPELLQVLADYGRQKQLYVVTHFNHPREITSDSTAALRALQAAGVVVKNQTVLLRGVNDEPGVLAALLRQASALGLIQHYIFQCRPVRGVKSQFQVPLVEASEIVQEALARQNGLGKTAGLTMSHVTGKLSVLGKTDAGDMLFQYRQAKDPAQLGRLFSLPLDGTETWLPDSLPLPQ